MRRNGMAVVLLVCCLGFLAQVSRGSDAGPPEPENLLKPLCDPCKSLAKKTIEIMPIPEGMGCIPFGTLFSTLCEQASGDNPAASVLCFAGGAVAKQVCQNNYGSPHKVSEDPGGAAKHICQGVKLCK